MCTVTFMPRRAGYCLAMNRDEQLTRVPALPPALRSMAGRVVLCPSEPGGGTWIGLNDLGACLALINWYSIAAQVGRQAISRGTVIPSASIADHPERVCAALDNLPLDRINPFRLIGIFPATGEIAEWRWNLNRLVRKRHPWKPQQWISSGFDEPAAQQTRSRAFRRAQRQRSAGSLEWLRRLHRSHLPEAGPFSICMHRADAATASYTEVTVSSHGAVMGYHGGPPCRSGRDASQVRIPVMKSGPGRDGCVDA